MIRLLLLEDDASLGETLKERLEKENYSVKWATNCATAAKWTETESFDLVILDIGLPDGSGLDFAKSFREKHSTPFLFVTAQNNAEIRLEGFEIGAEEFIPKPFHLKELLLRVRHILENHRAQKTIRVNGRTLDMMAMCVIYPDGKKEFLQAKDFKTLEFLIQQSPRVVSRDEILNEVWGADKFPSNRTVDNTIVRLRQALDDRDGDWIRSVRGVGYQWSSK